MRTFTLGYGPSSAPEGQIDRVPNGRIIDRLAIHFKHLEMDLMDVEDVIFERRVFDDPVFDRARVHNNVRRLVHGEKAGAVLVR